MTITGKLSIVIILMAMTQTCFAQVLPADIYAALRSDDSVKFSSFVTKDNINDCYQEGSLQYSLLSQAIRNNAPRCFGFLITKGADVNKACSGYVPPLMHAAKYGRLEMVKKLVAKGADINFRYQGGYQPARGQTPLTYAEEYHQAAVADYLRSLTAAR